MVCLHSYSATVRAIFLPSCSSLYQVRIDTTLFPSRTSTNNSQSDVDSIADTGPIDWDLVDSDRSSRQDQALGAGGGIQHLAEKELQAAFSEDLLSKGREKEGEEKRRVKELCQRLEEEQRRTSL